MDGLIGLKSIEDLHPDVVTLDLEMPRMDGMEMLRQITRKHRIPVIVFSARSEQGADFTLRALSLGAFDLVTKPRRSGFGQSGTGCCGACLSKIKAAAASGAPKMIITEELPRESGARKSSSAPLALHRVCRQLAFPPAGPMPCSICSPSSRTIFPGCLLVVQHMPEGFTRKIRAASERIFADRSERGAIGRSVARGPRTDLPGKPPHKGPSHGTWRRGHGGGRRAAQRPQAIGGCFISTRWRRNCAANRLRRSHDGHG